jgi:hypothetical protein
MAGILKTVGLAAIFAAGLATVTPRPEAAQLNTTVREGEGVTTELSANASAVTYWVNESDGWHVVTTVDTLIRQSGDSGKHAVVRFSSVLAPGQSQTISVPFAIGEPQQALRIRRSGDHIEIERVVGSS